MNRWTVCLDDGEQIPGGQHRTQGPPQAPQRPQWAPGSGGFYSEIRPPAVICHPVDCGGKDSLTLLSRCQDHARDFLRSLVPSHEKVGLYAACFLLSGPAMCFALCFCSSTLKGDES